MIKVIIKITSQFEHGITIDMNYEIDSQYKHVLEYYQENSAALRVIRAAADEITRMTTEQVRAKDIQEKNKDDEIKKFFGLQEQE